MGALREFGAYARAYMAAATQFGTYRLAREWMDAGVSAADAAGWANLGYLPEEAAPLIADGITPATVREMERHAEQAAGGRDALAAQRIQRMIDAGEIVDPAKVIRVQDPTDPTREIIALRDEQ